MMTNLRKERPDEKRKEGRLGDKRGVEGEKVF